MPAPTKDAKTRGREILTNMVSLFSEAERGEIEQKFAANEAALQALGEHGLRRDDHSRAMNETAEERRANEKHRQDLIAWKTNEETRLAQERERVAAGGNAAGTGDGGEGGEGGRQPAVDLTNYISKSEAERRITEAAAQAAGGATSYATNFGAYMSTLTMNHYKEYGEVLDGGALLSHCRTINKPIDQGGYDDFVKEKREAREKAKLDQALKEAEERGAARARSESNGLPYVSPGAEMGTLAGLKAKGEKPMSSTDAVNRAVETYESLRRKAAGV